MNRSKKILAASMAFMFGVSGLVLANHFMLEDADFEGNTGDWVTGGGAAQLEENPRAGTWSMSIGDSGGSATQTVEGLDQCSPYGFATFEVSGYYDNPWFEEVVAGDDAGFYASMVSMLVDFDVAPDFPNSTEEMTGDYEKMMVSGNIPAWATTMDVTISGMPHAAHFNHDPQFDGFVNVNWDDMELITDCVSEYAKISGKAGDSSKKGNRGAYSFSGVVATLESQVCEEFPMHEGTININYKDLGFSCEFTPTDDPFNSVDLATTEIDTTYSCGDLEADGSGTATLVLTQGTGGSEGELKAKGRGFISVESVVDENDGINEDSNDNNIDLLIANETVMKGNVHVLAAGDVCE